MLEALESFGSASEAIAMSTTLESIDIDTLDLVELGPMVDEEYGVQLEPDDLANVVTVQDAVDVISERVGTG